MTQLDKRPDIYLRELQAAAKKELGWEVSDVTLSRACRELRRTRKTKTLVAAEQEREDVAEARRRWAADQRVFQAWVEQHLLKVLSEGDIVVMDNLSSHKAPGVAAAIQAAGAEVRYLPPYSPDLNPIELAFSKFKKLLRDGAERTTEKLWNLCGRVLDLFTENECRSYLQHCGCRYS